MTNQMNIFSIILIVVLISSTTQFKLSKRIDQNTPANVFTQISSSTSVESRAKAVSGQAPFPFYSLKARHSNLCLEVAGALLTPGATISQTPCLSTDEQKFMVNKIK